MKKTGLIGALLLLAMAIQAQVSVKISPKFQKGQTAVYTTKTVTNTTVMGQEKTVNVTIVNNYAVTDATAEGYVIEQTATSFDSDVDKSDVMGRITLLSQEMLVGAKMLLSTDKDGKVQKILNIDELQKHFSAKFDELLDEVYASSPGMEAMMLKDKIKEQMMASLTEEMLLNGIREQAGLLCLNGRNIMTGSMEDYTDEQGMKMRRVYFPATKDGRQIKTTSTLNMTEEELKEAIIKIASQSMPEQAEVIRQNIDMVFSSGMAKIESNETADYTFFDNGWMQSLSVENAADVMGQKVNVKSVTECTEHSWK